MNILKIALISSTLSLYGVASELVTFKSHLDINQTIAKLKESLPKNGLQLISSIWALAYYIVYHKSHLWHSHVKYIYP